ncbi:putative SSU processome component Utp10 [Talaromyces proteolyticus]|uniref:U3 small nucleolar RNA-associated protein 10 n=1 Tax=Talaromyces proteolyticus TaxID=1131652 RepID=A0AAD4KZT7_9EURO|nr:putative SSU processome component Utp10 [Talaromyces proteolyticus]KAH8703156.1 putative SSU processome component Utp10 [Talaromyces proteolyticus]
MASSLSAQLAQIATKSTNQLDLKAQQVAHSKSLIFDYKTAKSQDFHAIYEICYDGFRELCQLDTRFTEFDRNIFSPHSKTQDRAEMTPAQNKELDSVLESFMALVGGRLQLSPAIRALEWLVRRFRVHEFNTAFFVLTFLPYHSLPIFLNLLHILPQDFTPALNDFHPYKESRINPPREAIVRTAVKNKAFTAAFNNYTLQVSKQKAHYHGLLVFWSGIMTQAISHMLDAARSGRQDVERKNHEDIFLRFLPVLNDGFAMNKISELIIGCYMITVVFATKAALKENVIDTLMSAVSGSWTPETVNSAMVTLAVLAEQKEDYSLPKDVIRSFLRLDENVDLLTDVATQYKTSKLLLGLISGCFARMQKRGPEAGMDFITSLFESGLLDEAGSKDALKLILQRTVDLQKSGELSLELQNGVSEFVQTLNISDTYRPLLQAVTADSGMDVDSLEHSLQLAIEAHPANQPTEDVEMEDIDEQEEVDTFAPLLESLSQESLLSSSFLAQKNPPLFEKLLQALTIAVESPEKWNRISSLPILGKSQLAESPQYLSFLIRVFSGHHAVQVRVTALKDISTSIEAFKSGFDMQALIPYIIAALADPAKAVRTEAAKLVGTLATLQQKAKNEDNVTIWAHDSLYEKKTQNWMSTRDAEKIVDAVLLSGLEGYVQDHTYIVSIVQRALKGSSSDSTEESGIELKKSLRQSFLSFLCSHVVSTPLFAVKLRLLKVVNGVDKISSMTRTKELAPLITQWRALYQAEVSEICAKEQLSSAELDQEIVATVSPKDKDAENVLISSIEKSSSNIRPDFVSAVFTRIGQIWSKIGPERQASTSRRLFDLSFNGNDAVKSDAREALRSVQLPGAILVEFLNKIPELIATLESHSPSPKRRRTNQNNAVAALSSTELNGTIEQVTYILELVDGSVPEDDPELSTGLFKALAALHVLKSRIQSSLGYLLSLALGSLLAIVNKSKTSSKASFDTSTIRADLVVDCVRTTESPQVQNTALLLVSGLAVIAPEQVLHSVMPIFTFMGSSVLKKDDDYSVMVIDQTIDQVVPVLVQSLRNQKRDVVAGTSDLLLSFTAAFEHIPSHRRQRLFQALVTKLGAQDFLFAVLAMLANRYGLDKNVSSLATSLVTGLDPQVQLISYQKYLSLVNDCLKPKPAISQALLGIGNEGAGDKYTVTETLLRSLAHLFKNPTLGSQMKAIFDSDDEEKIAVIGNIFSQILEQVLSLADLVHDTKPVSIACSEVLASVLNVLSLVDFLDTVEQLLQRPSADVRRKVLRLLENRLRQPAERDGSSQNRVLDFIAFLVDIVKSSDDILLKHAAVACIDRIAEKYGRKDTEKVIPAAMVIASDACLGQTDNRIRVMGLLCLASMADVLGEAVIPTLPETLKRSFSLLEASMDSETVNEPLHNAVFSLLSALLVQVPYMFSSKNLDTILQLSFKSAKLELSSEGDDARRDTLKLIAKKVDEKESFGAVERNWSVATASGSMATKEALDIVTVAIDKHPKSDTVKNVGTLTKLLHKAFDLRREQTSTPEDSQFEETELEAVEGIVNNVAIKMIYKLNDTVFRPLFIDLVEWATNGLPKSDAEGQVLRLTSFYKFLQTFFGTLKSIVTSYSSYILDNAIEVLKTAKPGAKESKDLWLAAVRMLNSAFEHDQDGFWQSPSHLSGVSKALISQLLRATNSSTATIIINEAVPAIAELAVAADSPDNYKEMNTQIMKYLRPATSAAAEGGDSAHTRLAALKAEQALTERLGEEWLALLPEMLPFISELMEDEDEQVEKEAIKWVRSIEDILGEKLDDMLT